MVCDYIRMCHTFSHITLSYVFFLVSLYQFCYVKNAYTNRHYMQNFWDYWYFSCLLKFNMCAGLAGVILLYIVEHKGCIME